MIQTENSLGKKHFWKERLIRNAGIIIVGAVFPILEGDHDIRTNSFWIVMIISILRTAALWYGSANITEFITRRFSVIKNPVRTILALVGSLTLLVFVVEFLEIRALIHLAKISFTPNTRFMFYLIAWLITFLITTVYAATFFFMEWHRNKLRAEMHERSSIEARYEVLRNQVNPHFLFNSLNTLSGMVEPGSPISRYIQNLSDFFRYILSVSHRDLINLGAELDFAKNYAYIQEQRFSGKLRFVFSIHPETLEKSLPPLSLQMLLENAVKHNEISNENPLEVKIIAENDVLIVQNPLQKKESLPESSGLGLENIRQRYAFLSDKSIKVESSGTVFEVQIPLL